jgi:hypothetical protein
MVFPAKSQVAAEAAIDGAVPKVRAGKHPGRKSVIRARDIASPCSGPPGDPRGSARRWVPRKTAGAGALKPRTHQARGVYYDADGRPVPASRPRRSRRFRTILANPAAAKTTTVSASAEAVVRSTPVTSLIRSWMCDGGSRYPNRARTCQCQSVHGQYPQPYRMPSPNQDTAVRAIVARCHRRVRFQLHPRQLKTIQDVWKMKKPVLSASSMPSTLVAVQACRLPGPAAAPLPGQPLSRSCADHPTRGPVIQISERFGVVL